MSDELSLIESVTLSTSAVSRSPCSSHASFNMDEDSLIENATLAKSVTSVDTIRQNGECQQSSSAANSMSNSSSVFDTTSNKSSVSQQFQDAENDYSVPALRPVKIIPSPRCDEKRGSITENVLINYANLSENELQEMERKREEKENSQEIINDNDLSIPKLDIGTVSDENDEELEKSDSITPLNVLVEQDSRKHSIMERSPRSRSISPRVRFADDDHDTNDADFNALIIDTANAMNASDFEDLKRSFTDVEGFEIFLRKDSPILFLTNLCRYRLISPDNLHHLQCILMRLKNPLLHMRARQYMRHKLQMVCFYPETSHIPLGFGSFKCHVNGKDFTRLKRQDLETLRSTVSLLLFIPASGVYITGIEPGINLVVSLMVPQNYYRSLVKMAADGLPELAAAGIDLVQIAGRTFKTRALASTMSSGGDHMRFLTVYQQLRAKDQQIQEQAREIAALKEDAEFVKLELETKNAEIDVLGEQSPRGRITRRHRSADRSYRRPLDRGFQKMLADRKAITSTQQTPSKVNIVVTDADTENDNARGLSGIKCLTEGEKGSIRESSMSCKREGILRREMEARQEYQWPRGDLPTLSRVRQIIERGEIMSEIETLLTELGVPRSQDDLDGER